MLAAYVSTPIDVVKTRIQTQGCLGEATFGYTSFWNGVKKKFIKVME